MYRNGVLFTDYNHSYNYYEIWVPILLNIFSSTITFLNKTTFCNIVLCLLYRQTNWFAELASTPYFEIWIFLHPPAGFLFPYLLTSSESLHSPVYFEAHLDHSESMLYSVYWSKFCLSTSLFVFVDIGGKSQI